MWDHIKDIPPEEMKVSHIATIPPKAFCLILGLAFTLCLMSHGRVPSVNKNTEKTGPSGTVDQIGHVLLHIIHAFVQAAKNAKIFQAKWDVKDGYWWLYCKRGEE